MTAKQASKIVRNAMRIMQWSRPKVADYLRVSVSATEKWDRAEERRHDVRRATEARLVMLQSRYLDVTVPGGGTR